MSSRVPGVIGRLVITGAVLTAITAVTLLGAVACLVERGRASLH